MSRMRRGFSLVELVIVIAILGVIAAIAVPRMSRGAKGAADTKLQADLSIMRSAVNMFAAEHDGTFPAVGTFTAQLTTYTDLVGTANATKTGAYIYGPYLEKIPTLRVGPETGLNTVGATAGAGTAWVYNATAGSIVCNTGALTDDRGVLYTAY